MLGFGAEHTLQDWAAGDFHYRGVVGLGDYNAVLTYHGAHSAGNIAVGPFPHPEHQPGDEHQPGSGAFREQAELVGLYDMSQKRMDYYKAHIAREFHAGAVPTCLAVDFDRMVKETRPDVVVVCSMDSTCQLYVIRAMELGCDAICEKPMTTEPQMGSHIIAGQSDEELAAQQARGEICEITHYPMFGKPTPIPYKAATGSHGGCDADHA